MNRFVGYKAQHQATWMWAVIRVFGNHIAVSDNFKNRISIQRALKHSTECVTTEKDLGAIHQFSSHIAINSSLRASTI